MQIRITQIQRFSLHDGPGVRTVVFFKGCPLDCRWCHNPETKQPRPQLLFSACRCIHCGACVQACPYGCHTVQAGRHSFDSTLCTACGGCTAACLPRALEMCGRELSPHEIIETVARDLPFYGEDGGLTLSGGEPMAQPEGVFALLELAKKRGIGTCIETCGFFPEKYVQPLMEGCGHILWDVKDTNSARHRANTGVPAEPILENLRRAAAWAPEKITLRCIILRGVHDRPSYIADIIALARSLGIKKAQLLPFHPFGEGKLAALGLQREPMGREYIPDESILAALQKQLDKGLC